MTKRGSDVILNREPFVINILENKCSPFNIEGWELSEIYRGCYLETITFVQSFYFILNQGSVLVITAAVKADSIAN